MRKYLFTTLVLALIAVGCGGSKPPPPPPQNEPPPPTAQQIYSEFKDAANPLWTQLANKGITNDQMEPIAGALKGLKSRNASQVKGPEAIQRFESELADLVVAAKKGEDWRLTRFACYAHKAIEPTSERFDRLLEQAEVIAARPKVLIKGFAEPLGEGDEVSILLSVTDPTTNMQFSYNIKEGQSFHTGIDPNNRPINLLKAVRMIGTDAVELEYLPISQLWTVSLQR